MEHVQRSKSSLLKASSRDSQEFLRLGQFVHRQWSRLSQATKDSEEVLLHRAQPALQTITRRWRASDKKSREPCRRPYDSLRLFENQGFRIDILKLPAGGYIPSHDHPQTLGMTHVASGTPWMIQNDRSCPQCFRQRQLMTRETSFTFPECHNIHGYYTDADEAILVSINIQQSKVPPGAKHWHFSTNLISEVHAELVRPIGYALMLLALSSYPAPALASECIMNQAQYELSRQNFLKAAVLLEDCAEKGHEKAQRKLGDLYLTGLGVEKDPYTAAQWYQKAAHQGDMEAQYRYGIMLLDGNGITEDNVEGFDWIFEAARAGHNRAQQVYEYIQANPAPLEC